MAKNGFEKTKKYNYCIGLTQQFRFCGNAFRADTYQGCDFGCKYCFANYRGAIGVLRKNNDSNSIPANIDVFKKYMENKGSGLTQELINRKVPIHLGGMSDPFQRLELKERATLKFLKIFKEYPVSISTKTANLTKEYWDILDPKYHVFQISLFSDNEETIRKFELDTPTAKERIDFIKELKRRGFWISVRIQPLIDVNEAISLLNKLDGYIDYATVEHIKVVKTGNSKLRYELFKLLGDYSGRLKIRRNYYKLPYIDLKNDIEIIKENTNVLIGVGDNEIHELSDSKNCCGLDLMPDSFSNWLKYNSQYIRMTDDKTGWTPVSKITPSNIPANIWRKTKEYDFKMHVDKYLKDVYKYKCKSLF